MLRKKLIRTWFGPLPPWTDQFLDHMKILEQYGWDFWLITDLEWLKSKFESYLGVSLSIEPGTRKAGDLDPYLGYVLKEELQDYDFWGHVNLDAVYGRLDKWLPDSFLKNLDIFGNDPGAICGPFTVYKNVLRVNSIFMDCPTWRENLLDKNFRGWDELDFNRTVLQKVLRGEVVMGSGFFQSHDHIDEAHKKKQEVAIAPNGELFDLVDFKEIMFYHFNQTRRWPVTNFPATRDAALCKNISDEGTNNRGQGQTRDSSDPVC